MLRWALLISFLLACGSPGASLDAGQSDARNDADPDTTMPDVPSTGLLTVQVLTNPNGALNDGPTLGATVVLTDTNGTQVVTTDAAGEASATVTGRTDVTLIRDMTPSFVMPTSVLGAAPGDTVVFREQSPTSIAQRAYLIVNFTATTGVNYMACGPCGCSSRATSPMGLAMYDYCLANSVEITFIAIDGAQQLTYQVDPNVTYDPTSGGTVTFSGAMTPAPLFQGTFTNVPSNIASVLFEFHSPGNFRRVRTDSPTSVVQLALQGWQQHSTQLWSTFVSDVGQVQYDVDDVTQATTGQQRDLSVSLLKWLGQLSFDSVTRTIHIPTSTAGADGDLVSIWVTYTRPNNGGAVDWNLYAAAPGDIELPTIPASVVDVTPAANTTSEVFAYLIDLDAFAGYAEARQQPYLFHYWPRPGRGHGRVSASIGAP